MTTKEIHIAIEQQVQRFNAFVFDDFMPEQLDLIVNAQINKFIKQRYSALSNNKNKGFEETTKRLMDLHTLVTPYTMLPSLPTSTKEVVYSLPTNFLFPVELAASVYVTHVSIATSPSYSLVYKGTVNSSSSEIASPENGHFVCVSEKGIFGGYKDSDGNPITVAELTDILLYNGAWTKVSISAFNEVVQNVPMRLLENEYFAELLKSPFAKSSWRTPAGILRNSKLYGFHDEKFILKEVKLTYIRKPLTLDVSSSPDTDCDLPEHTHEEIVSMAVQHILGVIESSRYDKSATENKNSE